MVTWNEYLKGIFQMVMDSHSVLLNLNDQPGDLDVIKKELLRINGFFNVLVTKLESDTYPLQDLSSIKSKLKLYLDSYYFEKEIETMAPLYSDDTNRIKNMRLKILESLNDKKLMNDIQDILEDL